MGEQEVGRSPVYGKTPAFNVETGAMEFWF